MPCEQMQQTSLFKAQMERAEIRVKTYIRTNIQNYTTENRLPARDISTDIGEPLERTMHAIDHLITRGEISQDVAILISGKHPRTLDNNDFIKIQGIQVAEEVKMPAIPMGIPMAKMPVIFDTPKIVTPTPSRFVRPEPTLEELWKRNVSDAIEARNPLIFDVDPAPTFTYDPAPYRYRSQYEETIQRGVVTDQGQGEYIIEYGPFGVRTRFVPRG